MNNPRILIITYRGATDVERGFIAQLNEAGLRPELMVRDVQTDVTKVPAILKEAQAFRPDLIFTWGTSVTLAVTGTYDAPRRHALSSVPVVFALVSAPVGSKIVVSRSGQSRSITGAVHIVPTEIQMRTMRLYKDFDKVGLLYNTAESNSRIIASEVHRFASANGLGVVERTVRMDANGRPVVDGIEDLVAQIAGEGAQWLYLPPDTFVGNALHRVVPASLEHRLPTFGAAERAVRRSGALAGLISRYSSVGHLAGAKALEILRDGRPASAVPITTLKRFSLIVNMQVAKALGGFYPPIEMLNYAEVINVPVPGASRS